ncbi:sodium-dependent bicarbonate transport family permease [Pseudonocardia alaniniphila]|uniref:Sodium-dependent bicarbonate transport family permease n=1 Tax=Pseudonocardia alaniniphila TaxID=75291 RepID=A0ABS9TB65_9PSEU|nr:sodium-dependent bicarbonate transport family permease [Pseudonocardia alaniniphila]MCH6165762.1 sodium-dependent bicarbonate transport family permease [Pseudonocardia alaniniphila]
MLHEFGQNFIHNLFTPLLLFFYFGFLIPILRVPFEFPRVVYQALTMYLLLAIGWQGGEELAQISPADLGHIVGFVVVGFVLNFVIGIIAYLLLKPVTAIRLIDKATIAGYYGSDSAGTFATCVGVLTSLGIAFDAYMPIMLAVMEIPGCLVALYLVARLRVRGLDTAGNMPGEPEYAPLETVKVGPGTAARSELVHHTAGTTLREALLNPGVCLLIGAVIVGFVSGLQGQKVIHDYNTFFVTAFQGVLSVFLLEMGMAASRKLKDLKSAGYGFVVFALVVPNLFAVLGILVARAYSVVTHTNFQPGTYVLFAVLCAAASYIAVPAVQRMAIPEASPTLPLAASLGLTFTYNVTIGISLYIEIARAIGPYSP